MLKGLNIKGCYVILIYYTAYFLLFALLLQFFSFFWFFHWLGSPEHPKSSPFHLVLFTAMAQIFFVWKTVSSNNILKVVPLLLDLLLSAEFMFGKWWKLNCSAVAELVLCLCECEKCVIVFEWERICLASHCVLGILRWLCATESLIEENSE